MYGNLVNENRRAEIGSDYVWLWQLGYQGLGRYYINTSHLIDEYAADSGGESK